jgi:hypothetical protein
VLNYCSLLRGRFNSLFSTKFIKAYWLHSINSKPTEKTRNVYGIELGIASKTTKISSLVNHFLQLILLFYYIWCVLCLFFWWGMFISEYANQTRPVIRTSWTHEHPPVFHSQDYHQY